MLIKKTIVKQAVTRNIYIFVKDNLKPVIYLMHNYLI